MNITYGWIPDENPEKDLRFADNLMPVLENHLASLEAIPATGTDSGFSIFIPEKTPISNQYALGSCVANAIADACELIMPVLMQLSRLFIYWNARNYHKGTMEDKGTYIRYGFDSVSRYGVCPEAEWGYDIRRYQYQPPVKCYLTADANKIHGYYRIYSTGQKRIDEIKAAVTAGHPVVFGTLVDNAWMNLSDETVIGPPAGATRGGHAMVVVGYHELPNGTTEFYIRNSWGTGWGKNGYGWMSQDYLAWAQTQDIFVPTMVPVINVTRPA